MLNVMFLNMKFGMLYRTVSLHSLHSSFVTGIGILSNSFSGFGGGGCGPPGAGAAGPPGTPFACGGGGGDG